MKLLAILRHAKSDWSDPALEDFDRPLNDRGHKAASRMGEELRRLGLTYDLALVSPARRAVDTFAIVGEGFGIAHHVRSEPRLYGASVVALLTILREAASEAERLLIVGHNPGLHQLALRLAARGDQSLLSALEAKLPTGSLVEIGFESREEAATGRLLRFLRPRELAG